MKQGSPSDRPEPLDARGVEAGAVVPAGAGGRRKRRFVWALLFLLAGLAAGVFLWIRSTPAYALRNIRTALAERDAGLFYAFVDVDAVVGAAARDFRPPRKGPEPGLLAKMRKTLAGIVNLDVYERKKAALDALEAYWTAAEAAPPPSQDEPLEIVLRRHLAEIGQSLKERRVESDAAEPIVRAAFEPAAYGGEPIELRLRFRRAAGRLRLVEIVNFREALQALHTAELRWKRAQNAAVEREFALAARVTSLGIGKHAGLFGTDRTLTVRMTAMGLQKVPWVSLRGSLRIKTPRETHAFPVDALFGATGEGMVSTAELALHEETGTAIPADVWDTPVNELNPSFHITGIHFADGKTLTLPFPDLE